MSALAIATLQPTPAQVDALIAKYSEAQKKADASGAVAAADTYAALEIKAQIIEMVEAHGFRHTEKSKRLAGRNHTATTTTATRLSIDAAAVERFRLFLEEKQMGELAGEFFTKQVSYSLVSGPMEILKGLSLGKRVHDKVASLVGLCFQVKTSAPSLKIDVGGRSA